MWGRCDTAVAYEGRMGETGSPAPCPGKVSSPVCDAGDHSMQGELPAETDWGWEGGRYKLRLLQLVQKAVPGGFFCCFVLVFFFPEKG